jgi:long-chain acyl-CoA synthetase
LNNIVKKFIENSDKWPQSTAIKYFKKRNLYTLNWQDVYLRVEQYFQALDSFSIEKGQKVCILADTCKEWGFFDMAIMAHGAVTVPLYHSSPNDEIDIILQEIKPIIIIIQNQELYEKIKPSLEFNKIKVVILINDFENNDNQILFLKNIISQRTSTKKIEDNIKQIKDNDLATIIYTSGTSGLPKGVELNHSQIISSTSDVFPVLGVTNKDCSLTFLPFSHVLGRMELWGHYYCGYTIGYAESIELIKRNLLEIQPTVLVGVPRIFEKIYFGIRSQVEISKLKQNIFKVATQIGFKNLKLQEIKKAPSLLQALQTQVANKLVFNNIKNKLGGNLRFAISGGAPLEPHIAQLFAACGIYLLEGYGLTETTGPIFINTLFERKAGSVGKAIGDVELRFDTDKEILIKSKKVMARYYLKPQETKEVTTEDGFFRTGDIGELDENGFLTITDRKKDLIKTAGGKFIAPQKIQNLFVAEPLISHVHITGDKQKYIVALVTLEKSMVLKLKRDKNITSDNYKELVNSNPIQSEVRNAIANINAQLGSFETIKRYYTLENDFSIEGGELTPSLKMKRKFIDSKYSQEIESLYH